MDTKTETVVESTDISKNNASSDVISQKKESSKLGNSEGTFYLGVHASSFFKVRSNFMVENNPG